MTTCNGTFVKGCVNIAVTGFKLCVDCNTIRLEKQQNGICSANAKCTNSSNKNFPWCRWCHASKMINKISKGHDCSKRGGTACSTCDEIAYQARSYLKTLESIPKKKPMVTKCFITS